MSDYKPTFKVSATRRSLFRRLTPVTTALLLLFLVIAIAVVSCESGPDDEPWQSTPTTTTSPTPTETLPTPTPTVWYEEMITPTPMTTTEAVTTTHPVTWEVTVDADGYGRVPQRIDDWVWDSFITALGCDMAQDPDSRGAGPDVIIPPDNMQMFEEAVIHLPDDPDVLFYACGTSSSKEDILNPDVAPLAAEFGLRVPAVCDTPTYCHVGIAVEITGAFIYDDELCQYLGLGSAPCKATVPDLFTPPYDRALFEGVMEYDEETGVWILTQIEKIDL